MPPCPSTPLAGKLEAFARAARRGRLALGVLRLLGATLALWLVCFALDNLLRLPSGARLALGAAGVALPLFLLARGVLRPSLWRLNPQRTARELEEHLGMGDNLLINACQFERLAAEAAPTQRNAPETAAAFTARTLDDAARRAAKIPRDTLLDRIPLARFAAFAAAAALAWGLYAGLCPRHAANAFARFARPLADIPPAGNLSLLLDPAGAVQVAEGASLAVRLSLVDPATGRPPPAPPSTPVLRLGSADTAARDPNAPEIPLAPDPSEPGVYTHAFENIRESFACRAACDEDVSAALRVEVRRLPRIASAVFRVTPPGYLAEAPFERPGPPAALSAIAGSHVTLSIAFDREPVRPAWRFNDTGIPLQKTGGAPHAWRCEFPVEASGPYAIEARSHPDDPAAGVLARGSVALLPDAVPSVRFDTDSRNRRAWPGETLDLDLVASDDHGLRSMRVTSRPAADASAAPGLLREWSYEGPPGRRGEVRERLRLVLDPARFEPGGVYILEAVARDGRPGGDAPAGRAEPVVLRIRSAREADATASPAAAALQRAIAEQRRALGLTRNLGLHLGEAVAGGNLPAHRDAIAAAQAKAREHGRTARAALDDSLPASAADRLDALVEGEMGLALDDAARLAENGAPRDSLERLIATLDGRQQRILDGLLALLGSSSARERDRRDPANGAPPAPAATRDDQARDLRALLRDFTAVQKRIVEQSRSLLERGPDDLSEEEEDILGRLAREEAELAALLRDKVDDLSRNPLQDFADGSLADEFNEVYQEVAKAAAALYEKKIELAVPMEQSGLENAERILHNLERWLADKPDYLKWLMEDPPTTPDAPLADLPGELEDIVGELLDEEEAMTEDVEDATSAWIDSIDKGAGWDAMDGPISSMGAKGVTGNLLPNQMEIGGRSGEGRTGRSQGQMVESAAEGKNGRPTPSRLAATPFETGSVDDRSTLSPGGATGGGKLAGFAGEGLRGPSPAPRLQGLERLAGRQMEIRQAAERLSLHLRAYGMPSGDVEQAVRRMREVETLARAGEGGAIRRSFDEAVDSLREARGSIAAAAAARRERGALPRKEAAELWSTLQDDVPPGYEELLPAYFRRLADEL
ncbi:MAG: hypothetical protein ACOX5G_06790 [Kiritimatiellia bacterium]|jgi:hypothetical protein